MFWVWLIVLILMVVVEALTPAALICIWFAVGALASGILALFGVDFWIQLVVFGVVSVCVLLIFRPLASRYVKNNRVPTNYDQYIGKMGVVIKTIEPNEWGMVKIENATWSAKGWQCTRIEAGAKVEVMAIEGVKLIVKQISC